MIKQFDTNGEPVRINGIKHTVKNYAPQTYETPYGPVQVDRYTYQICKGGRAMHKDGWREAMCGSIAFHTVHD